MNHSAFQAILQDKDLRHTQDGQAIAEFVVTIPPLREEDPPENLKAIYWGENGEKAHRSLQPGDQLILQGQLKITKVTHKTGEEEYVEQQASLIVEKINRIQRAS
ncbi:single-stranded DNA-binding protein [Acaryochloris marina NIES-2412]|uniref:single-stranded DNA-binding protein n=1 Tax=Acaryochloris marina TaxID=155978 RepID=UPI00405A430D